ncbi:MAG: c-type cytochrome domain-containing protein [Pirellulales bacterium]
MEDNRTTQPLLTFQAIAWRVACLFLALPLTLLAQAPGFAQAPDRIDYRKQVEPILRKYCAACHNDDDREGGWSVSSYETLLKGGDHGAVLTAGNGEQSRLVRLISGKAEPRMPPKGSEPPTAVELKTLVDWISAGAPGPTGQAADPADFPVPQIALRVPLRDAAHAVAVSPDGQIVSIARHGVVELRSTSDLNVIGKLTGHRGSVNSVAFSRDGQWLAAAAGEPNLYGEVRLWKVVDRKLQQTLRGHRDSLLSVAFSPDGQMLATGGYDQKIKLWRLSDGRELKTLEGHNGPVFEVAFRPDGKVLASASGDRTVKLWDVATGARLDTLKEPLQELYTLAFSPDGRHVAAGGVDNRIRLWRVSEEAREGTNPLRFSQFAHELPILRLAFSADGRTLVSTSEDRLVKVWNVDTMTLRGTLPSQADWPVGLALHPTSPRAYVARIDGVVQALDYPAGPAVDERQWTPLAETPPTVSYGPQPKLDALPKVTEAEPNDGPSQATPLVVPGIAEGRIQAISKMANNGADTSSTANSLSPPEDVDLYRFSAKQGEHWIVETRAAQTGSPLDSKIQILDAAGKLVPRLLLRAVRDSEIEFRSMDSSQRGVRLKNWEEMLLNEYVYLNGEVIKHFQQRRGPDADSQFYPESGSRFAFFDTTSRTHALGAPAYVVVPYPLDAQLPNNGLPVFTLPYENDDESQRKLGKDSRLTFVAPADGEYLIRVADVRGFGGEKYSYQLVVRRPEPSFQVSLTGVNPTIAAGSGKAFLVKAERIDQFMGPIEVDVSGLPPGYRASTPLVIQAGLYEARGVIYSDPDAPPLAEGGVTGIKVTASAEIAGQRVTREVNDFGTLKSAPRPKVVVHLELDPSAPVGVGPDGSPLVTIVPGRRATCRLRIERNGFTDRVQFEIENLPHGVIVDDIGLNGVLLPEGQSERILFLSSESWVPGTDRRFHAVAKVDGDQVSRPLWLRVASP